MLAAVKLGAVPINVNYRYVEEELRTSSTTPTPAAKSSTVSSRRSSPRCVTPCPASARSSSSTTAPTWTPNERSAWWSTRPHSPRHSATATSPNGSPDARHPARVGRPACRKASRGATTTRSSVRWAAATRADQNARRVAERASCFEPSCVPACPIMHATAEWTSLCRCSAGQRDDPDASYSTVALGAGDRRQAGEVRRMVVGAVMVVPVVDTPGASTVRSRVAARSASGGATRRPR